MVGETKKIQVHQVLATLGYGDAIGHEVLGIRNVLNEAGYASRIYVQTADPELEDQTDDYRDLITDSNPENILIHHFSIGSRASRVAYALPERMILVYHNITPPEYFVGINSTLVELCHSGRRELSAYASRCDLALGDSEFNKQELDLMNFPRTDVLPVIPNFDHLDVPGNRLLADGFDDDWINILFVGRLIPNKKIEDLIKAFHVYKSRYNPKSRLLLVGAQNGFRDYVSSLHSLVAKLNADDIHLIGHISNEELTTLYDIADLFLSASEHEGFCVPLLEAFYKNVPVMAYAASAIPTTMDGGGVLYENKDPRYIAATINSVLSDEKLLDKVLSNQDAALKRLQKKDFSKLLLAFVNQVKSSARIDLPPVTKDFWKQYKNSEMLEQLRISRPSAFNALPKPPANKNSNEG